MRYLKYTRVSIVKYFSRSRVKITAVILIDIMRRSVKKYRHTFHFGGSTPKTVPLIETWNRTPKSSRRGGREKWNQTNMGPRLLGKKSRSSRTVTSFRLSHLIRHCSTSPHPTDYVEYDRGWSNSVGSRVRV